jgi:ubiquinone/menaquinone biosynthesis C-methylase UbiE
MSMDERKLQERTLHDYLYDQGRPDERYTSNRKYYSIAGSNRAFVVAWLKDRCKDKVVLDYCCGNGEMAMSLAENAGAIVHGIDISPVAVNNATSETLRRGLSGRATFHAMDAEQTTFNDGVFDFAVANGVLHHLDLQKAYGELARLLKPDGAVICTEALRHNPMFRLYRKLTPHMRTAWEADHILGRSEIELAKAYFEEVRVVRFSYLVTLLAVPLRRLPIFDSVRRCLEYLDAVLLRIPGLRWQAWMAVFVASRPKPRRSTNPKARLTER